MSDFNIRELERRWRESGQRSDRDAWERALVRGGHPTRIQCYVRFKKTLEKLLHRRLQRQLEEEITKHLQGGTPQGLQQRVRETLHETLRDLMPPMPPVLIRNVATSQVHDELLVTISFNLPLDPSSDAVTID